MDSNSLEITKFLSPLEYQFLSNKLEIRNKMQWDGFEFNHNDSKIVENDQLITNERKETFQSNSTSFDNSCFIQNRETIVYCSTSIEITKPNDIEIDCGFLRIDFQQFQSLSSTSNLSTNNNFDSLINSKLTNFQLISISQYLQESIIKSNCLNLQQLCIKPSEFVWIIYIDLICIKNDGNLISTLIDAIFNCLERLKLPNIKIDENQNIFASASQFEMLKLSFIPKILTFAVHPQIEIKNFLNNNEESEIKKTNRNFINQIGKFWILKNPTLIEEITSAKLIHISLADRTKAQRNQDQNFERSNEKLFEPKLISIEYEISPNSLLKIPQFHSIENESSTDLKIFKYCVESAIDELKKI